MSIRDQLLAAGVKELREYGFPGVTKNNIVTDKIYAAFFKTTLEGTLGKYQGKADVDIRKLLGEIEALEAKAAK